MQTPLVSIIIPTYNRAHLIGETLDSVLAQTYTHWECIVVDDGSTDETDKLLATYCANDNRFQYHHRPSDRLKGANACRNYGFEICRGEYVNWFDSDDLMISQKMEIQVNELHNSSFDYTICQTIVYDVATNKEIGLRAPKLHSDNIFEDYILFNIFWLTGAPLWKKSFIKQYGLSFDETLQQAQDYDFHMRVLAISDNYFYNEIPLVHFLIHELNMSNSMVDTKEKIYSNAKVFKSIILNYSSYLEASVVLDKFKLLITFYREAVRRKQLKNSILILSFIIKGLKNEKLKQLNSSKIIFETFKALPYLFFGIGFKYTKLNILN